PSSPPTASSRPGRGRARPEPGSTWIAFSRSPSTVGNTCAAGSPTAVPGALQVRFDTTYRRRHARRHRRYAMTTLSKETQAERVETIVEFEKLQVERANSLNKQPVVFVHGLWLLPSSWNRWTEMFEAAGYTALTPGWPDDPPTVQEANANPDVMA